jgi:tetratricopeptide (TPR) repeat protein/DNA-binding CsgD family transcriptional regulator
MQNDDIYLPNEIYTNYLKKINNISFSPREIDVMACLFKGRTTKKIANILSISPKTVSTHLRNIMLRLETNSREGIIDCIEKDNKSATFQEYYENLLLSINFEQILKQISSLINFEMPACSIVFWKEQTESKNFANLLKRHLNIIGINVFFEEKDNFVRSPETHSIAYYLYIICSNSQKIQKIIHQSECSHIFLFLNEVASQENILEQESISLHAQENYYFLFLELLKKILPTLDSNELIVKFKQNYNRTETLNIKKEKELTSELKRVFTFQPISLNYKKKFLLPIILISFLVLFVIFITYNFLYSNSIGIQDAHFVQSEFIIPSERILLDRPELLAELENKFKKGSEIQTVALVGTGGAGKTTLSRKYARSQKHSIIWEVNAETQKSLLNSFERLAYNFSKTDDAQKTLKNINSGTNSKEREEKIIQLVREKLKNNPNWLLVFDNVEKFSEIQKYFPHNAALWGKGNIILTTRDQTIQNNSLVDHTIKIGELKDHEKYTLFKNIVNKESNYQFTEAQEDQIKEFLKKIPSFPLDVSVAAYYLKATNINCDDYLNNLVKYNDDFSKTQENILKEAGDYSKTRYNIIILSLKNIMNKNKHFEDLLIFISLLDSQHIPIDLLNNYKDKTVVDNFIYNLKKHSFIAEESPYISHSISTFSIHKDIQEGFLIYLLNAPNLKKKEIIIQKIYNILEEYIKNVVEKKDYSRMALLMKHYEKLLTHECFLKKEKKSIYNNLGIIHFYLSDYAKAEEFLKESILIIKNNNDHDASKIAKSLTYLGNVYRELGKHEEAKNLLSQGLEIYKKHLPNNHSQIAQILISMGMVYKSLGNYEDSKKLLEQSLVIYKKFLFEDYVNMAWSMAYLGNIYRELGDYKKSKNLLEESILLLKKGKIENRIYLARAFGYLGMTCKAFGNYEEAKTLLEESLKIYKEDIANNHIYIAGTLVYLGSVYCQLRDYKKAQALIEQSLKIYKARAPENQVYIAWALGHLGCVYKKLEAYEKAKNLLGENLKNYEKHYGKNHTETARILTELGEIYYLENQIDLSEKFNMRALKIFQSSAHPDAYRVLENLTEIFIKKSENEIHEKKSYFFRKKAFYYLNLALETVNASFPKDSPHVQRIQHKIKILLSKGNI